MVYTCIYTRMGIPGWCTPLLPGYTRIVYTSPTRVYHRVYYGRFIPQGVLWPVYTSGCTMLGIHLLSMVHPSAHGTHPSAHGTPCSPLGSTRRRVASFLLLFWSITRRRVAPFLPDSLGQRGEECSSSSLINVGE